MKLSELIKMLQEVQDAHGDQNVFLGVDNRHIEPFGVVYIEEHQRWFDDKLRLVETAEIR